jgi:hypothetical protein
MIWDYHKSKPRGSVNFRPGSNPNQRYSPMAQADSKNTTPTEFLNAVARVHLSHLFQDPFLRAAFRDDDLAQDLVEVDRPETLDGGAAERVLAMAEGLIDEKAEQARRRSR